MRASVGALVVVAMLAIAPVALGQDDSPAEDARQAADELTAANEDAPRRAAEKVYVGALINDIQQLDLQTHSYAVDIYIWFKWRDPEDDDHHPDLSPPS